jgi:hypothetical protein
MFVRFVILEMDKRSHMGRGLLHAADALCANDDLAEHEESLVCEILDWFDRRLPIPTRFARSSRPHAQYKAVSWFKYTAREFIARMAELAAVVVERGRIVERLTTDRPGYIVYEDEYQVVAEPFRPEGQ